MKQLLIVNSNKALNAGTSVTAYDFSGLDEGAISFFECGGDKSASTLLSGVATKNFGIALGRGANKPAFVIPEIDISTLEIVQTLPYASTTFARTFTMPTAVVGKEYGIMLIRKGTVPRERSIYTTSIVASVTTAATVATAFRKAINDKTSAMFPFVASGSSTTVTITCQNAGEDWEAKLIYELSGVSFSSSTNGKKAIGDKAYMTDLAQRCAADKGFVYLDGESKDLYSGFPETLEGDWTMNTSGSGSSSSTGYKIYNLHFATGRVSGKQVDERVWQYVHIAVPLTKADGTTKSSALDSLNAILPEGVYSVAAGNASIPTATSEADGYLTKTVADTLYDPL